MTCVVGSSLEDCEDKKKGIMIGARSLALKILKYVVYYFHNRKVSHWVWAKYLFVTKMEKDVFQDKVIVWNEVLSFFISSPSCFQPFHANVWEMTNSIKVIYIFFFSFVKKILGIYFVTFCSERVEGWVVVPSEPNLMWFFLVMFWYDDK